MSSGALVWKQLRGGVFNREGIFQAHSNLHTGTLSPGSVLVVFGEGSSLIMDAFSGSLDITGWLGFEGGSRIQKWQCMAVRNWLFGPIYPTMTVEEQVSSLVKFRVTGDELDSIVTLMLGIFDLANIRKEKVGHSKIPEQFDNRHKTIILATRLVLRCPLNILYDPFADMEYDEAHKMMRSLKLFAQETGSFVILSVESLGLQQAKLIELADKVMLASHSGKVVFHGSLVEAMVHFRDLGYGIGEPVVVNLGQLVHLDQSGPQRYIESLRQVNKLENSWSSKFQHEPPWTDDVQDTEDHDECVHSPTLLPKRNQFALLVRRFALMFRDIPALIALFIQSALPILLISFIFFRKPLNAGLGLTLRSSLFISLAINNTFALTVPEALFFRSQYPQVEWEAGRYKFYKAWLVPLARLTIILPFRMALVILLSVPLYFITGLRTDNIIYMLIFEGFLLLNTAISAIIGILIGAWMPSLEVTQLATVLVIDIYILFGGLGSPGNNPTWILRWIQYLSPIYYTFRGLLRNELVGQGSVDWGAYLRSVEIERLTGWWAAGGLLILGAGSLALLLLHTVRIS